MQKTILSVAIGTTLTLTLPPVFAQNGLNEDYWWFGLSGEYYNPDKDRAGGLDDGWGIGEEFGYRFSPDWAGRIELTGLEVDIDRSRLLPGETGNDAGMRYGADVLYFVDKQNTYVFTGLKKETLGDEPDLFNIGVGKHWPIDERWHVISEAAWYRELGESNDNLGAKLGIAYKFGYESKQNKLIDTDRDGVYDHKDQCPGSETRAVDRNGCAVFLDGDSDGVKDSQDRCPKTHHGVKVDRQGCALLVEVENEIEFTAFFEHDSATVKQADNQQLRSYAARIKDHPSAKVVIEGHASRPGTNEYNMDLSNRRAEAIKRILVDKYGVDAGRIILKSYGETMPVASANTVLAEKLNRRVEASLTIKNLEKATK